MRGAAEHLYVLALALEVGRVKHLGAAILLYQAAAALDYDPATIRLAYLLDTLGHRGLCRGTETAVIAVHNGARVGDVRSMQRYLSYLLHLWYLSYLSYYGDGSVETYRIMRALLTKLVEKGDSLTLANIGRGKWDALIDWVANGPKVCLKIDRLECLRKAAEMGVVEAKTKLARLMYESVDVGEGVDGAVWAHLLDGAEAGDVEVLVCLHGWLWKSWDSAPLDFEDFVAVAQDSALHHGDMVACFWLARGFLQGSPLPLDLVVSSRYFRRFSGLAGLLSTDDELPELFGERLCLRRFLHGGLDRFSLSIWPPARRVLRIRE